MLARGETSVTLSEYIVVFGAVNLLIAQCPNFHSIRFVNQCSTFCTISFSIIAVAMSIYAGALCPSAQKLKLLNPALSSALLTDCLDDSRAHKAACSVRLADAMA